LALGCAGSKAPREPAVSASTLEKAPAADASTKAPRLFPPARGPNSVTAGLEHDGSRRVLAHGLRMIQRADASMEVSEELLPAARSARFLSLPQRLGGGFLFWILSSSVTLLYHARSWTAPLRPVAQLDFEVERIVAGFDRLLVLPRRDSQFRALDLARGEPAAVLGLPEAPSYGEMVFVDGWFGAVQVPLRGTLVTFDAGATYHPLDLPVTKLESEGPVLLASTATADYALHPSGELAHLRDRDPAQTSEAIQGELARALKPQPEALPSQFAARPLLETAALSGIPDGRGGAFVVSGGALLHVALDTGRVLDESPSTEVRHAECRGVRVASGVGFVCGHGPELTRVYALGKDLELVPLAQFAGARRVSPSGSGALVVSGGCSGSAALPERYCVLAPAAALREISTETARDRVVALSDGRVVVLTPPVAKQPGSLRIIGERGDETKRALVMPRLDVRQQSLLQHGIWLDGLTQSKAGELQGWLVGAASFAGVRIGLDGKLSLGRLEDNPEWTLFDGPRAFSLGQNGLARESTNGGLLWQNVELPPDLDVKALPSSGLRQGCSEVGCAFAGFTRIGYFGARTAQPLASPAAPALVRFPSPGGSRWLLRCRPTGEVSAAALPSKAPAPPAVRRYRTLSTLPADAELPPLSPFLELEPPRLPENSDGVDAGTEAFGVQSRVYAFGPRGTDWTRTGSFTIAFADRFSVSGGARSTAPARSPWADALTAADALGAEPSTSAAGLFAALDASGSAGALLLNSRGSIDLFLFEAGRVPQRIANVGRQGLGARLAGVVRLKSGFFLGSFDENSKAFRVYRVQGQELSVVLEAFDVGSHRGTSAELVRSASSDALAIWIRGHGWFVHPLDVESGAVDAPYVVEPAELGARPPACTPAAEGYVITAAVSPDPYAELPAGMSARGFEGRFRVSALGVCLDELAAQGEAVPSPLSARGLGSVRAAGSSTQRLGTPTETDRPTVAVTLTERKPGGRRIALRCSN
jgi:hypothetical protein